MYWIGTSGWSYRHWKGPFYPDGIPQREWLRYYSQRLGSVEVNATFYRLQRQETLAAWAASVPDGFRLAFKASRYLTHTRKLLDVDGLRRLLETTTPLGEKRGPMLLQLPPAFPADPGRLSAFLDACPDELEIAVEFRDSTWFIPEIEEALRGHGAALVWSDYGGSESPRWDTAPFLYVRRHGADRRYAGRYGRQGLQTLASTLEAAAKDVYCYFNNDVEAAAPLDALELVEIVSPNPIQGGTSAT